MLFLQQMNGLRRNEVAMKTLAGITVIYFLKASKKKIISRSMKLQTHTIRYKQSLVHVSVFGSGPKWLFCFHGFGQDGNSFHVLEKSLGTDFTLIAIDFPFHGKTEWNEGLTMNPEDLLGILAIIIHENNESNDKPFVFSILGYSLGGRVALHLLQMIPTQIERMVLLAPDGLKVNFWYWLGTQTWAGNKLFNYTMKRPQWFFSLLNLSSKGSLANKSVIKFVHKSIDDPAERLMLYNRWTTMRLFKPNIAALKHIIKQKKIPVRFLYGSYDRVILSKRNSLKKDSRNVTVTVVEGGHELIKENFSTVIASLFSQ